MLYSNLKYFSFFEWLRHFDRKIILPVFTVTIFLSAFLLFSIQPFFTKLVLPKLGGSPGVWSVAMVFFQGVLLCAYAYAHVLTKFLRFRSAVIVHGLLLLFAFVFLPLGLSQNWLSPPNEYQEIWTLGLFAASIGVPFFAVSANAPLLQAWFARSGHEHASDPYFLYGASNIGSFLSLFSYILIIEPAFALNTQSLLWTFGYLALAVSILSCGLLILRRQSGETAFSAARCQPVGEARKPLVWTQRLSFVYLSAIPSALTIAITAHISVDIASAPFIWVVPLALFLLTFVIAFRTPSPVRAAFLGNLIPWVAFLVAVGVLLATLFSSFHATFAINLIGFFIAALYCHTLLYKLRPDAGHLTEFYLWISVGGVLGGLLTGLAAPQLFNWVAEYPILWFLVLLTFLLQGNGMLRKARPALLIGAVLAFCVYQLGLHGWLVPQHEVATSAFIILSLLGLAALIQLKSKLAAVPVLFVAAPLAALHLGAYDKNVSHRSFFGITKVSYTKDGDYRLMVHGTTVHGAMEVGDAADAVKPVPLTYYHETGEMSSALRSVRSRMGGQIGQGAIVGLGTGSFLCHRKADEQWTVFEIDPAVIDIGSDPRYFRFVSECAPDARMVLGDARQTLTNEPEGLFDFLLIDAFSSNAIPVHLMTREALQLYFSKIADDGLLVMHISNRNLELKSVVAAIAELEGWSIRHGFFAGTDRLVQRDHVYPSDIVVLARSPEILGDLASDPDWTQVTSRGTRPWTDDYSNILSAIMRQQSKVIKAEIGFLGVISRFLSEK